MTVRYLFIFETVFIMKEGHLSPKPDRQTFIQREGGRAHPTGGALYKAKSLETKMKVEMKWNGDSYSLIFLGTFIFAG